VLISNGDGTFQNLVFHVAGRDNSAGNPIVAVALATRRKNRCSRVLNRAAYNEIVLVP
jgi:hypothetical protein